MDLIIINAYAKFGKKTNKKTRGPSGPKSLTWVLLKAYMKAEGAQWLSGRVLDSRPKGHGFEPHRRHYIVVLEQDTFILA